MIKIKLITFVLLLAFLATAHGGGMSTQPITDPAALIMYADTESREVYSNGALVTQSSSGNWHITQKQPVTELNCDGSLVLAFKLPERPSGKLLQVRALMFYLMEVYLQRLDRVDLYGIKYMPASTPVGAVVEPNTYFLDAWGWDPNATPLDRGVLEIATCSDSDVYAYPWRSTSSEGSLRLSYWLNSLYDNGAMPGDYALLRLNANQKYTLYTRIKIRNVYSYYDDNVRIYYDLVNELPSPCPTTKPDLVISNPLAGDIYPNYESNNNWIGPDGKITFSDFAIMAAEWLECDRIPARLCD
ncbi:MAG: hypothetical protein ABFD79_09035 [Phycisphaerales bacterium]